MVNKQIHCAHFSISYEVNQRMKFGQLIKYNKTKIFFFKNHAENEAGRLVPDQEAEANGLQFNFNVF